MADVDVNCEETGDGWQCSVTVDEGTSKSTHTVDVPRTDYNTLTNDSTDVETLVEESFHFLLKREPKESILGQFDIMTIERYFPEYPDEIPKRL